MIKKFLGLISIPLISTRCVASTKVPVDVSVNEEKVRLEVVNKTWTCPTCNSNEQFVLKELQERTMITDHNAYDNHG